MLAVCLGHLDAAKLLIEKGANVNTETDGWTCVQVGNVLPPIVAYHV